MYDKALTETAQNNIKRILVIQFQRYGDVLLITPLFSTLKINYPKVTIDVLVYKGTDDMIVHHPDISCRFAVDRNTKHQGIRSQYIKEKALFKQLSKNPYDLILNLSTRWRAGWYCYLLRPACSISFEIKKRSNFFWRKMHSILVKTNDHKEQHTVSNNLSILDPLSLKQINTDVKMAYHKKDMNKINKYYPLILRKKVILIHPVASLEFKNWSKKSWADLINHLTAHEEIVAICHGAGSSDYSFVDAVVQYCNHRDKIIKLGLQITELAAFMDYYTKLFIGVDSAPMHMAAALKVPSVALFGPTNIKQWHPWAVPHTLIWAGNYDKLPLPEEINVKTKERYLNAIPSKDVIVAVDHWIDIEPKDPEGTPINPRTDEPQVSE